MTAFSTHRIGMAPAGTIRDTCPHGYRGSVGCNWCATQMPDEFISRGRGARRNPLLGWQTALGVVAGLGITAAQGDTDTPSLLVGAAVGGIVGFFVSTVPVGEEAEENPLPAGLGLAAAGKVTEAVTKGALRAAIKKKTDEISELADQLSQQVKDSGITDKDDDDDDERAKPNPIPVFRVGAVVLGTGGAIWALNRFGII